MKNLARPEILKVKPYIPGKPVEEVRRELGLRQVVKLASNENSFGPSPKAMAAIRRSLPEINRYPESGSFYLRRKLARRLGVGEKELVFGNGSDELIVLALRAFVNPGEEVIVSRPTFLIYEIASSLSGARVKTVPMRDFRYDLVAMKKAISKKTKLVFIANPDNPTGTYVTGEELREFFKGLPAAIIVFLDEAYFEFAREEPDFPDSFQYLKKNLIIARTFSKVWGLSGLRLGYGICRPKIAGYLERVREPFNVNRLAQVAALAALDDREHLRRTLQLTREGKDYLSREFEKMGLEYLPSATNFILLKVLINSQRVYQRLLAEGVVVREMSPWRLKGFLRVTVGKREENRKFIKALRKALIIK